MSRTQFKDELHTWIASGFFGDAMIDICKVKQALIHWSEGPSSDQKKEDVVFHTGKDFFHPNNHPHYFPANQDVLTLLNCIDFTKGIIFDFDQRDFMKSINESNYAIEFPEYPCLENWTHDIRENINFNLFPERVEKRIFACDNVAVIHPISAKNKPPNQFEQYYVPVWKETINSLKIKKYKIILIGGKQDAEPLERYSPEIINDSGILNLIGKLSFFESLDLIWNYSKLNVSCCSWTAWYSKAAGIPTAMMGGYDMLHDLQFIKSYKLKLIGNDDCFMLESADNKENADKKIAHWVSNR